MKKIIIEVRPNENTMRDENPNVPWTPREIAQDAAECREAGAALIHVHGRTPSGAPDSRPETHAEIVAGIRERCDLLVAPPLAGAAGASPDERLTGVGAAGDPRTRPDFLVVDMGCANMDLYDPVSRAYASDGRSLANDVQTIGRLLAAARELGTAPYLTTFNVSWTRTIAAFLHMGAVDLPALVGIVLGGPAFTAAHPGTPAGLRAQLDFLPGGCEWTVCTYLGDVLEVAETVIDRGGHLSIGLGDHPHTRLGRPTNAELVHRVAELARARGREVATPEEARRMLGLPLRRAER